MTERPIRRAPRKAPKKAHPRRLAVTRQPRPEELLRYFKGILERWVK